MLFLQEEDNMKLLYEKTNAIMPNANFDSNWVDKEVDKTVVGWMNSIPVVSYQFFYPPMFESEGIIPVVQNVAAGLMTAEDGASELDAVLVKWSEQNPDQLDAFKKWDILE